MLEKDLCELVEKAKKQDEDALAKLIKIFEPLIYSQSLDEDMSQNLFLTLIEAINRFKFENPYNSKHIFLEIFEVYNKGNR